MQLVIEGMNQGSRSAVLADIDYTSSRQHRFPRLQARTLSHSRIPLDRQLWQSHRAISTACLLSLIHCSAVPRLM